MHPTSKPRIVTSPRLGVRFTLEDGALVLYRPGGERFVPYVELRRQLERERQRAERLAQRLRELGVNPDEIE